MASHEMRGRPLLGLGVWSPFKFWNDQRHFLMITLEKVRAEFSLSTLAYDIKRAINVLGVTKA